MADKRSKNYPDMTDDELNAELDVMVAESKRSGRHFKKLGKVATQLDRTVPISIRVPARLLQRLRDEASRRQVPYQRLMLNLAEAALDADEGRALPPTITVPVDADALRTGHLVLKVVPLLARQRKTNPS